MRTPALLVLTEILIILMVVGAVYAAVTSPGGFSEIASTDPIIRTFETKPNIWDKPKHMFIYAPTADVQLVFLPEKADALNDTIPILANYPFPMPDIPQDITGFKIIRPVSTAVRVSWW